MFNDFIIPFLVVGLAELGDKTQLAVFCLSSKTKDYFKLILGVMAAFLIADGLAILFGEFLTKIIPTFYIKLIAGFVFLIVGIFMLFQKEDDEVVCNLKTPFLSAFTLILISEMGDKTQITAALFAVKYNPLFVFMGVMLALLLLSLMAVYLGKFIFSKIKKSLISQIAGTLFVLIGVLTLMGI